MVSPFLSFATGALEAVRSRQEADFEAERKEAERQQKIEDAKALARFEFELKQKVKSYCSASFRRREIVVAKSKPVTRRKK